MKNFINRALVEEKKLFFFLAAALISVSVMAEGHRQTELCHPSTQSD